MIAVLLAGIGAQADAEQTQPGRYHHIRGGDRQRGGAAGSHQPAVQAPAPVRPAGGQDSLVGYGGQPEPAGSADSSSPACTTLPPRAVRTCGMSTKGPDSTR